MVQENAALLAPVSTAYLDRIQAYWRVHYGRAVDPRWHVACAHATGIEDVRYIPHPVWWDDAIPFFNDMTLFPAYSDKNLSDILLRECAPPRSVVKRMHGGYYDGDHSPLRDDEVIGHLVEDGRDKIIKPARTDNGRDIRRIAVVDGQALVDGRVIGLPDIERRYGREFIVQALIVQHPHMAEVHPHSVNTLRLLTMRWRRSVQFLLAFARFGTDGQPNDNASSGGLCCGIDDDGRLHNAAVDHYGRRHSTHPTSGYAFSARRPVPGFETIRRHVVALHDQIPHFDLVSWDIAVSPDSQPIFVEANFRGAVWVYQFACRRPVFGDLTPEVLEVLRRRRSAGG